MNPVPAFAPEDNPYNIIYVDVTHRCQMSCANCYLPNRQIPDLAFADYETFLRKLGSKTQIRLVGGEATLRSDLPELIALTKEIGHLPVLVTNGLKLSDRDYVQTLFKSGLRCLQLSMNGFDEDAIYQILDQQKCAKQKMQALENCLALKMKVSVSAILMKGLNEHLITKMMEYARRQPIYPKLNFRSRGNIGRFLSSYDTFRLDEMVNLIRSGLAPDETLHFFYAQGNQVRLRVQSPRWPKSLQMKLTDWQSYERTPDDLETDFAWDPKRFSRGRMTQDFKVSPWFEHVVENEFGY